jgi:hypothetical protein
MESLQRSDTFIIIPSQDSITVVHVRRLHPVLGILLCIPLSSLFSMGTSFARGESPQEIIAQQVPAALQVLDAYHTQNPVPSTRTLHVVYWTPSDRDPQPQYRERLTRTLFDIREFYRREMKRLGFGERTIRLATADDGLLTIHVVRGLHPYAKYQVQSGGAIRQECLPTLKAAGIDPDRETLVIFCNMSNWDPQAGTMSQNSPYYASGGLRNGTAWQVDSALLDADLLTKQEPLIRDGQYGKISVGRYNSIFVGGVCHELGHALGLPHNRERADEHAAFGTALMGSGNRTYGEERRGEGRGSFLTLCEGLRLASHPLFTGSEKGIDLPANAQLSDISVALAQDAKSFTLAGKVTADPPAYAVLGYMDPEGGSDYDATTTTAVPNAEGKFQLTCAALKLGKTAALRIVVCQANGGRINDQTFSMPYTVANDGTVDVSLFQARNRLKPLTAALQEKDPAQVQAELSKLEQALGDSPAEQLLRQVARTLAGSLSFQPGPAPVRVEGKECWLSDAQWKTGRVGWGKPVANRLPHESAALVVGGQLFPRGLYAHAPSSYVYDLGGKWQRLSGKAGLADGNEGSVVFVISGDGKELWRSKKITAGGLASFTLNVADVQELHFQVENANDGNGSDWGIWADPKLER